ncbi:MAG: hypothetical protein GY952_05765 [Rhodobacteraceae bacterium]|nr:hypothetical protein [Paracoccaceae bacterium]
MESTLHHSAPAGLAVIETLRFDPVEGFGRLGMHLDRAERTCAKLGFSFDRGACLMTLGDSVDDSAARVRMTMDEAGEVAVATTPIGETGPPWNVAVATPRLNSTDPWLRVKTTERGLYDAARKNLPETINELIFLNENDEVCEGTITNVFVDRGGVLLTPPVVCGLLPGILRQELLETGQAMEAVLRVSDLQSDTGFYVGNSLRGLIPAVIVD